MYENNQSIRQLNLEELAGLWETKCNKTKFLGQCKTEQKRSTRCQVDLMLKYEPH